ncbi:MAG: DUF1634 domain-containing protein [Actinobacteria bacterium]|nr:DUF1634 domain-containing protein [Actinomycetota bacterium]
MNTQLKTNNEPVRAAQKKATVEVAPEQIRYANLLLYGSWAGIATLLITFALYMTGIMPSYVDPSQMQYYWGMKASEYLSTAQVPHGWGWLKMVGYGDFITLLGIAWLGILTILGYFILLPAYMKKKDGIYSTIVVLEILVLILAASGILKVGGH